MEITNRLAAMKKVIADFVGYNHAEIRLTFVSDKFKNTEDEFIYLSIACVDNEGLIHHMSAMNILMFDEALKALEITHPMDLRTIRTEFLRNPYIKKDFGEFFGGDGEEYLNQLVDKYTEEFVSSMVHRYSNDLVDVINLKLAEDKNTKEIEFTWDNADDLAWLLNDIKKYEHTAECYCMSEQFADYIDGYILNNTKDFAITKSFGHFGFKWEKGKVTVQVHDSDM